MLFLNKYCVNKEVSGDGGDYLVWGFSDPFMQFPPPFRSGNIYIMKDALCAETNEKSVFPFLVFE